MQERQIKVTLSISELRKQFEQHFTGPNKALFSEAVLQMVATDEWKLEKLYRAAIGIEPTQIYAIGTKIKVEKGNLDSTWQWDEEKMLEEGILVDGRVEATVIGYDKWAEKAYKISYTRYKSADGDPEITAGTATEDRIVLSEEFPEKFSPDNNADDDLPF